MRKIQFVAAALMLAAVSPNLMAQDQPPGGQRRGGGGNQMTMLMQGITLTAEQQVKVDSIAKKYADERTKLMQDESMDRQARMMKTRELTTKQIDEIKPILTDEQKKVLEKNQADMAARMQGGGRPPR